ncbi:hypothetical protein R5R35_000286 [Gryllus longicercus]|uniref:DNA-directed RNA polymerase III subunit n=1 Tax=Gryllus longicercus TaxID=2509291 RepID=A0AAN9VJV5_9ORTH
MAGRGRGGGGRGRGRGAMSFNVEQLGFGAGEALPGPVLQPPPLYPPLERRPVPLKSGSEVEYLLALKRDYVEFLKYSPAYVLPAAKVKDIERYSDYKNVETPNKNGALDYDWKRFPMELRPVASVVKKKRPPPPPQIKGKSSKKVRFAEDVSTKLDELEKLEEQGDVEEKSEENKEEEKEEGEQQEGELEEEEDQDEEMDDGTDYVNNYFDNGESYLDEEDDNLDDGPVY